MKAPILFAALLLVGCGKQAVTTSVNPPVASQWEFAEFEMDAFPSGMHMAHTVSVLKTFHEGGSPAFTPPEICCELADLMNVIGKYGWDYAGKDGNKILVRRPYMVSQDGAFIVGITNLAEK